MIEFESNGLKIKEYLLNLLFYLAMFFSKESLIFDSTPIFSSFSRNGYVITLASHYFFSFLRLINAAFSNRRKRIESLTRMGKIHELMLV